MLKAYTDKNWFAMMKFFPLLVETIIELKRFTRKFLAGHQNVRYVETDSSGELELPEGFRVVYRKESDYYYCLMAR